MGSSLLVYNYREVAVPRIVVMVVFLRRLGLRSDPGQRACELETLKTKW